MNDPRSALAHRPIQWHWTLFLLGAVYAVPAMIVMPFSPTAGLALAVGVIPVAAFDLPGYRRGRRIIPLVGLLSAVGFLTGSLLTQVPFLAVCAMFGLAVGCTWWARQARAGALALAVVLPLTGIALSYRDLAEGALIAVLMLAGSLYAWGVAMLWPERQVAPPARPPTPTRQEALTYGALLGMAAAIAALLGYVLELEHVGWATGTVLLVMRPGREQLVLRGVGRAASVVAGAFAAAYLAGLDPPVAVTIATVGLAIAALAATQGSRWYIAPAFTTYLALTLILQGIGERPGLRFAERALETLIGVALALLFGAVIPILIRAARTASQKQVSDGQGSGA